MSTSDILRAEEEEPVEAGELSKIDRHPSELDDIDAALGRLDEGKYGICETCGKPIGDERLEAKPWARFCIVHQAEMERALSRR